MSQIQARIQPLDSNHDGAAAEVLGAVRASLGRVPNIFATMAHSPAVLQGYLAFSGALGEGRLSAAVREQIALTVAGENACDYCASAHTALARGAGVSVEEAARNLRGEASDARIAAILSFARTVVRERGHVGAAELDTLRAAGVDEGELVEIIANIAANLFTNYFNHLAGTEIDFPAVSTAGARRAA